MFDNIFCHSYTLDDIYYYLVWLFVCLFSSILNGCNSVAQLCLFLHIHIIYSICSPYLSIYFSCHFSFLFLFLVLFEQLELISTFTIVLISCTHIHTLLSHRIFVECLCFPIIFFVLLSSSSSSLTLIHSLCLFIFLSLSCLSFLIKLFFFAVVLLCIEMTMAKMS